jgi:hypothetical protein
MSNHDDGEMKQSKKLDVEEIESLNSENLDVQELERRLELASMWTDLTTPDCYIDTCGADCGSNCVGNCGSNCVGNCPSNCVGNCTTNCAVNVCDQNCSVCES